jgi:hypothetical protein
VIWPLRSIFRILKFIIYRNSHPLVSVHWISSSVAKIKPSLPFTSLWDTWRTLILLRPRHTSKIHIILTSPGEVFSSSPGNSHVYPGRELLLKKNPSQLGECIWENQCLICSAEGWSWEIDVFWFYSQETSPCCAFSLH